MMIAMICPYLEAPVGNISVFLNLAKELKKTGHKVDIYCCYFDPIHCFPDIIKNFKVKYLEKVDSSKKNLKIQSLTNRISAAFDYYFKFGKIYSLMRDKKYDLVFAAEIGSYVPALIYKKNHGSPVIWSVFDPITLIDRNKPDSLVKRIPLLKLALKLHNLYDSRKIGQLDRIVVPTSKMKLKLDKFYNIESLVFPTAGINRELFKKRYTKLIEARLKSKFNFIKKKETILFTNAHFQPHRRFEDIIKALKILVRSGTKNLKLIISGSDKFSPVYYQYILKLIRDLSLKKYVIIDSEFKSNEEVAGYYQYCDIFLFVSVEQTWGLAPFEAMACHKPTIISDGVDCTEVLTDYFNALVVKEKSPREISNKIGLLLKQPKTSQKIGENGYLFTKSNFYYDRIVQKLVKLFERVLESQSIGLSKIF